MFKQIVAKFMHLLPHGADRLSNEQYRSFLRWLMPNGGTLLILLLYFGLTHTWGAPAITPPPPLTSATQFSFSGYLANANGTPLNGNYTINAAIYAQPTGGAPVWGPETHNNVPVVQGNWSVGIGSVLAGGIPATIWEGDRYLQITIQGETLSPRQQIRSMPTSAVSGLALTVSDGSIQARHLNLQKDSVCLSQWTNVSLPGGYVTVPVPGLTLNFTLDTPGQVLVWIDGLAKMQQASAGELGVLTYINGSGLAGSYSSMIDDWFNVSDMRLVNLASGSHTIEARITSLNPGTAIIHGINPYKTCLNYLTLGN